MKMISKLNLMLIACFLSCSSCQKEELNFLENDIRITVETGDYWLHDFPLFLGLKMKNPPQFAIWLENTNGQYISTVFATQKIATEGWVMNNGNRRKEALPHWCFQRGVVYGDGLLLPTKKTPLTDGITGATPKNDKTLQLRMKDFAEPIVIKAEFNHSTDFNDSFPENAKPGDENYSGGEMGSGQPAVIYAGTLTPGDTSIDLILIGRSSADGSNGNIYQDLEKLSTATSIVKRISVQIVK